MRLFFAIIIALNSAFTVKSGAEFSFKDRTHRFPDTREGVLLKHDFLFVNTGDEPLVIADYKVACSCTKLIFPKEPILPGKEGVLSLSFDTNGKYGYQSRKVEIVSNAKRRIQIGFKVTVVND